MAPVSEVRIRISELHRLPTASIRILADAGIGGQRMDQVLSDAIHVECVGCGIRMPIKELMALSSSLPIESSPKIDRIRLGYCARNSCSSQFYVIGVGQDVGLDRGSMLERLSAEIAKCEKAPEEQQVVEAPTRTSPYAGFFKQVAMGVGGVAMVVAAFIWWRNGAYIPGISKKPQLFIAVDDATSRSLAEPRSIVPANPPSPPPGGKPNERIFRAQ